MSKRLDAVLSWLLTLSAVAIAGVLVRREFFSPANAGTLPSLNDPITFVDQWRGLVEEGVVVGSRDAPIMVVQFSDLECPFCRRFHGTLRSAQSDYGDKVAYSFVHYPLSMHKLARPAAIAAECAGRQNRFAEYLDAVFEKQDSLGQRTWTAFAADAGVRDTAALIACMSDTAVSARVERNVALGDLVGVRGTPTVIVNGWRFPVTPPDSQFRRVIDALLEGRAPESR